MRVAALQYAATGIISENQQMMQSLIEEAAGQGATLICLPECANLIAENRSALHEKAEDTDQSSSLALLCQMAKTHGVMIAVGSLMLKDKGADKARNRGFFIASNGSVLTTYDKIHMFDADVGVGKTYRESHDFEKGHILAEAKTEAAHIGLSICYDLRFAGLYRALAQKGVEVMLVPAAFTATTGAAHWEVLLRARAIETGAFVIAAAQGGRHADNRQTWGHALIISPWGDILADAGPGDGTAKMAVADLNLDEVKRCRNAIRAWQTPSPFDSAR